MKVTTMSYRSNPIGIFKAEKYQGLGIKEQVGTLGSRSVGAKPKNLGKNS